MNILSSILSMLSWQKGCIHAPAGGKTVLLEKVPDPVFSEGMLGKGFAIESSENMVCAPVSGTIAGLTESLHAVGIVTDDGAEVLIHVGVDTVTLGGRGFRAFVRNGERVRCGQKLIQYDSERIRKAGLPDMVIFTVSNTNEMAEVSFDLPDYIHAGDRIGRYRPSA